MQRGLSAIAEQLVTVDCGPVLANYSHGLQHLLQLLLTNFADTIVIIASTPLCNCTI